MVSSKFKSVLATIVQHASSIGSIELSTGVSPTRFKSVACFKFDEKRFSACFSSCCITCCSSGLASLETHRRKPRLIRSAVAETPSRIMWLANNRAASTYVGSLSKTKDCSGVLVRARRAMHTSRFGASKLIMDGGGQVLFQKVYMLRR